LFEIEVALCTEKLSWKCYVGCGVRFSNRSGVSVIHADIVHESQQLLFRFERNARFHVSGQCEFAVANCKISLAFFGDEDFSDFGFAVKMSDGVHLFVP
tara:strand:+ start:493 stop:789 length:297 start_codon:yes stop_codon:yes gene_type:complete